MGRSLDAARLLALAIVASPGLAAAQPIEPAQLLHRFTNSPCEPERRAGRDAGRQHVRRHARRDLSARAGRGSHDRRPPDGRGAGAKGRWSEGRTVRSTA